MGNEINSTHVPIYERVKNCAHTQQAWNKISEEVNSVVQTTDKFLNSDKVSQNDISELSANLRDLHKVMVDNLEDHHVIYPFGDTWVNDNKKEINAETIDAVFDELQPLLSVNLTDKQDKRIIEKNTDIDLIKRENSTSETSTVNHGFFKRTSDTSEDSNTTTNINGHITEYDKTVQHKIQEDLHKISNIAFNRKFQNTVETLDSSIDDPIKCLENLERGNMESLLNDTKFIDPANKENIKNRVKQALMKPLDEAQSEIKTSEIKKSDDLKKMLIGGAIGLAGTLPLVSALLIPAVYPFIAYTAALPISALTFLAGSSMAGIKIMDKHDEEMSIELNQEKVKTYEDALNKFNELTK